MSPTNIGPLLFQSLIVYKRFTLTYILNHQKKKKKKKNHKIVRIEGSNSKVASILSKKGKKSISIGSSCYNDSEKV